MKTKLFTLVIAFSLVLCSAKAQSNVSLYNIQYSPVDSPYAVPNSTYANQYVKTGGIITGVCSYGYYMQTSYATEWAAINVYDKTYASTVAVGDSVTLTAQVTEYYNETELDSVKTLTVVSSGNQARTPATVIALDSIQQRRYQGMLIKIKDATCIRYNTTAAWWVFSDSTMLNHTTCEDTVDNILMATQTYIPGDKYDITGCIHFEYANWIEPRSAADIQLVAGIGNIQNNFAEVNVFPNPSNGIFTASVELTNNEKNTNIVLTDLTGRVIQQQQLNLYTGKNTIPINISNLEKGIYFLQMGNSEAITVKKILVQ